ncbi:hypothetical protein [Saccharopolyspora sp. 5N708]|uniref:hypothetical protein n=1 Tax=Saccharopolyspora sp. 5N708 TaxID=3457424 RepID=UPI003FD1A9D7
MRDERAHRKAMAERAARVRVNRTGPSELGALLHVCRREPRQQRKLTIRASLIGLVVVVAVLWAGIGSLSNRSYEHWVPIGAFGAMAGIALSVLLTGFAAGFHYLRHRDEEFRLHEGGFVHADARGTRNVLWDDIVEVGDNNGLHWTAAGNVKIRDGRTIVVSGSIQDGSTFVEDLRQAVYHGRYPRHETHVIAPG